MSDNSFVVVAYDGRDTAVQAADTLHALSKEHEIKIRDMVLVYKTDKDKIKIHPKNDMTAKKGGLTGGAAGLIIGFMLGGPLLGAAVGVATGALAGNISGVDKDVKHVLEEKMKRGDSALCVLVKYAHWQTVQERMAQYNGHVLVSELSDEALAALEEVAGAAAVATAVADELAGADVYKMKVKRIAAGNDYTVENGSGEPAFRFDGEALSSQNTIIVKDVPGAKLCEIREVEAGDDQAMEIERDGDILATVVRHAEDADTEPYVVRLADGSEWAAVGDVAARDYRLVQGESAVATVSGTLFAGDDDYGVEIEADQPDLLILSAISAMEAMSG